MDIQGYKIILLFIVFAVSYPGQAMGQQGGEAPRETEVNEQLKNARSRIKEMALTIEDMKLEKETMQGVLMELRADKELLEKEMYDMLFGDFRSSAKESINLRFKKVREPFEEEIKIMNKMVSSYKKELQEKEEETAQLLNMVGELEERLLFAGREKIDLEQRVDELTLDLSNLREISEKEKMELRNSMAEKIDKIRVPLEVKIEVLEEQIEEDEQANKAQRQKLAEEHERLNEKIASYKAQLQAEGRAVISKESEMDKLNEKISQYAKEIEGNRAALGSKDAQRQRFEEENKRLNEKIKSYEARLQDKERAVVGKGPDLEELNEEISRYKKEIDGNKAALESKDTQLGRLKEKLGPYKEQIRDNEQTIKELRREKASLEGKYEALLKDHDQAKYNLTTKIKAQEKRAMNVEQQRKNKGEYLDLLKHEVENALDLILYP